MNKNIKTKLAFTLIELLVVIAIIGILSGVILTTMSGAADSARVAKLKVYSNSVRDILGANLVSEWNFDNSADLGRDIWGSNDGTLSGTSQPTYTNAGCVSGGCLNFGGGGTGHIDCGVLTQPMTQITISGWFKVDASGFSGEAMFDSNNLDYGITFFPTDNKVYFYINGGGNNISSPVAVTRNIWHLATATYDKSWMILYIDGAYSNSKAYSTTMSYDDNLYIGRYSGGYFKGFMDDVRIYSAAYSASQIQQDYFVGLNKLLAKGNIGEGDYEDRVFTISPNYGKR
jgi:prepilin-type N-terminal cleavage/methylation domain-containing protein